MKHQRTDIAIGVQVMNCQHHDVVVADVWATQIDTSAGFSETDVNELAEIPTGAPPTSAATAVTPDGKAPKTWRSRLG